MIDYFPTFILKLSGKYQKEGNSGIFYRASEDSTFDYIWKSAAEMQVLDNTNHPDAALGKDGNRQAGSLYDLFALILKMHIPIMSGIRQK